MRLTSQLITESFPDLDKVERLNIEAFPEEETGFLYQNTYAIRIMTMPNFFAFYNEEEFVGFAFYLQSESFFMLASLPLCPTYVATVMVKKSLKIGRILPKNHDS